VVCWPRIGRPPIFECTANSLAQLARKLLSIVPQAEFTEFDFEQQTASR